MNCTEFIILVSDGIILKDAAANNPSNGTMYDNSLPRKNIKSINKTKPITTSHSNHNLGSTSTKFCLNSAKLIILLFVV